MHKTTSFITKCLFALTAVFTTQPIHAQAPVPAQVRGELRLIENNLQQIERKAKNLSITEKMALIEALTRLMDRINVTIESVAPVVGGRDGWFQAVGEDCNRFCSAIGMMPGFSPEGAQCASGETVPASSLGIIDFQKGCWPNCEPRHDSSARSEGQYCYNAGQKKDRDKTDLTMGCYCGL